MSGNGKQPEQSEIKSSDETLHSGHCIKMIQTPILSTAKGQTQNETVNLEETLNSTCLEKLTVSFCVK